MRNHSSYDEGGPLAALGEIEFSAESGLPTGRNFFKVPIFLAVGDKSSVVVEYDGLRLTDFGTSNDYYGFGTSPETALIDASDKIRRLKGANIDIRVITTLVQRPCFPSDDEPFYGGSQRVQFVPMTWRCSAAYCTEKEEEFIVWENGHPTEDARRFFDVVTALCNNDAAPKRSGNLRSIIDRKKPSTREDFLVELIKDQ